MYPSKGNTHFLFLSLRILAGLIWHIFSWALSDVLGEGFRKNSKPSYPKGSPISDWFFQTCLSPDKTKHSKDGLTGGSLQRWQLHTNLAAFWTKGVIKAFGELRVAGW